MNETDQKFLRRAITVARRSRENGNHPFGAILVDESGNVLLEGESTIVTGRDITGHAETNLIRLASGKYDPEFLAKCTLYASTEPCPMCAGAIFWGNVKRVVFALSMERLYAMAVEDNEEALVLNCQDVLDRGRKSIEVVGPFLEEEAIEVHAGFWD